MIDLHQGQNPIWDNNWPQKSVVNSIDNKTNTTEKIYNSNQSYFACQKASNNEYRS